MDIANRGPQVQAVAVVLLTLSWVAVGLRCVSRVIKKLFRIEDWLALAAIVSFSFFCAVVIAGVKAGGGRHLVDVTIQDFSTSMMWWYCGEISYVTTTCLIKASISIFLLQICIRKYQRIIIWTVLSVIIAYSLILILVMAFQCSPPSYFWTQYLGEPGSCMPGLTIANMTYSHGALSIWSDWTLGILPIFLVWNLNMNPRTKVSVAVILGVGALGSTASIVRFLYIHQLGATQDFLWHNVDVSIWSTVEPGVGIVASSMATMRPLFMAFFSRSGLRGSSHRDSSMAHCAARPKRIFSRSTVSVEELGLSPDLDKSIRVTTTVTKTSSKAEDGIEDGSKRPAGQSSDSIEALSGENEWARHSADGSSEEAGRRRI